MAARRHRAAQHAPTIQHRRRVPIVARRGHSGDHHG